ncbi:hypothetical protein QL093DRAFT_2574196 [Fusarium oxysporum]|nr:hypothetical protein QL093DRAFT_2574196 [Fusarium oxysporum]
MARHEVAKEVNRQNYRKAPAEANKSRVRKSPFRGPWTLTPSDKKNWLNTVFSKHKPLTLQANLRTIISSTPTTSQSLPIMATELKEYLVIIPDLPDVLAKRQVLLKPHNQDAAPLVKAGRVPFFGSTLAHHSPEGQQVAENGTVMIIKAESEEEIREIIRKDIFTIEGVWDFGKLSIWPFKSK